jgi:TolB protein
MTRPSIVILSLALVGAAHQAGEPTLQPLAVGAPGILGSQGNRDASSFGQAISADGRRVVFSTRADNLDPTDRDANIDVYLADLALGTTRVVGRNAAAGANAAVTALAISPDGRWIAWTLRRFGSVSHEETATLRLHDTVTEQTLTVLERERSGLFSVALSEDARSIALTTTAALVDADADGIEDVYVWTRADEVFKLASRRTDGSRFGRIQHGAAVLTPSGRHLAFVTQFDAFIPGSRSAVQVVDLASGTHEEIGAPGAQALQIPNGSIDLSADARFVALATPASLLPIDVNGGVPDVYLFDRQTQRFELLSVSSAGVLGNCASDAPRVSHDGRRVVFRSCADSYFPGADGSIEIYVRDRLAGQTVLQTRPLDGRLPSGHWPVAGNLPRFWAEPSISGDGSRVAFASAAEALVKGDSNRRSDVFVVDQQTRETRRAGLRAAMPVSAGASRGALAREGAVRAFASRNAASVVFNAQADNLVLSRAAGALRVDLPAGAIEDALADLGGDPAPRSIEVAEGISDDGTTVLIRRALAPPDSELDPRRAEPNPAGGSLGQWATGCIPRGSRQRRCTARRLRLRPQRRGGSTRRPATRWW